MTPAESAERSFLLARLADVTAERDALAAQVQAVRALCGSWEGDPEHRHVFHALELRAALADAPGTEDA